MPSVIEKIDLGNAITASALPSARLTTKFAELGYVTLANAIDAGVIDGHLQGLKQFDLQFPSARLVDDLPVREGLRRLRERYAFQAEHEPTLQLQFSPALADALRQLLRQEPVALFTTTFEVSPLARRAATNTDLTPHLHNFELVAEPADAFVLAWIALEDVRPEAGPMWILPGSHHVWRDFPLELAAEVRRHPRLLAMLNVAHSRRLQLEQWSQLVASITAIARKLIHTRTLEPAIRPHPVLLKKGDVLLFDPSLLHGTLPPNPCQGHIPRRSCNIRFIGIECRMWNYAHRIVLDATDGTSHVEIKREFRRTRFGLVFQDYLGAKYAFLE
jgi:hypothetical protein